MWRRLLLYAGLLAVATVGVGGGYHVESNDLIQQALPSWTEELVPGRDPFPAPPSDLDRIPDDRLEQPPDDGAPEEVLASTVPPPLAADSVYLGLYRPQAPFDADVYEDLVADLGSRPAILMWYQQWAGEPLFPVEAADELVERGVIPMITWESWQRPPQNPSLAPTDARQDARQPDYRLDRITAGDFDPFIERYARSARAYGGPVMMRLFHEMDGFWYPWGGTVNGNEPEDLVPAWRHVVDIFERVGATNVTWVWTVNHESVPDRPDNHIETYYPGDEYVDWVGVDGFNFGTTSDVSRWQSFREVYEQRFEELAAYDKPVIIGEFATVEQGGDKAAWITDAFATIIDELAGVDAVVWYDREVGDVRDFRFASSPPAERAFRDVLADPEVLTAPAALERTREAAPGGRG